MSTLNPIPFSVLDLAGVREGGSIPESLGNTLDLARHAERWGYTRFWLAEHHNMPGISSAATSVLIGHVAGGTSAIRVGSGGIMLPNHAPLVVAEQFGTLEALYPGRIDLGLGRAPGTDQLTAQALRRTLAGGADRFPQDVVELLHFLAAPAPEQGVTAVPGANSDVEVWILGSSTFGAQLAAVLGLPYAFASHFAPAELDAALAIYRQRFEPSERLQRPYVVAALMAIGADTDAEARRLFSSTQQSFVALRTGQPGPLPPPVDDMDQRLTAQARAMLDHALSCAVIGSRETVADGLAAFAHRTRADELMVTASIYDHPARVRSFEIVAEAAAATSPLAA